MSDLFVGVFQSTNVSTITSNWTQVATVNNANSVTVPVNAGSGYFMATILAQIVTLAWQYPASQISPGLSFNLYWQPDGAQSWTFVTNIPPNSLSAQFYATVTTGQFALTATDSVIQAESDFSNVLPWTNSVGDNVRLGIQRP